MPERVVSGGPPIFLTVRRRLWNLLPRPAREEIVGWHRRRQHSVPHDHPI